MNHLSLCLCSAYEAPSAPKQSPFPAPFEGKNQRGSAPITRHPLHSSLKPGTNTRVDYNCSPEGPDTSHSKDHCEILQLRREVNKPYHVEGPLRKAYTPPNASTIQTSAFSTALSLSFFCVFLLLFVFVWHGAPMN